MENQQIDPNISTFLEDLDTDLMENVIGKEIQTDKLLYEIDYVLDSAQTDLDIFSPGNSDAVLNQLKNDIEGCENNVTKSVKSKKSKRRRNRASKRKLKNNVNNSNSLSGNNAQKFANANSQAKKQLFPRSQFPEQKQLFTSTPIKIEQNKNYAKLNITQNDIPFCCDTEIHDLKLFEKDQITISDDCNFSISFENNLCNRNSNELSVLNVNNNLLETDHKLKINYFESGKCSDIYNNFQVIISNNLCEEKKLNDNICAISNKIIEKSNFDQDSNDEFKQTACDKCNIVNEHMTKENGKNLNHPEKDVSSDFTVTDSINANCDNQIFSNCDFVNNINEYVKNQNDCKVPSLNKDILDIDQSYNQDEPNNEHSDQNDFFNKLGLVKKMENDTKALNNTNETSLHCDNLNNVINDFQTTITGLNVNEQVLNTKYSNKIDTNLKYLKPYEISPTVLNYDENTSSSNETPITIPCKIKPLYDISRTLKNSNRFNDSVLIEYPDTSKNFKNMHALNNNSIINRDFQQNINTDQDRFINNLENDCLISPVAKNVQNKNICNLDETVISADQLDVLEISNFGNNDECSNMKHQIKKNVDLFNNDLSEIILESDSQPVTKLVCSKIFEKYLNTSENIASNTNTYLDISDKNIKTEKCNIALLEHKFIKYSRIDNISNIQEINDTYENPGDINSVKKTENKKSFKYENHGTFNEHENANILNDFNYQKVIHNELFISDELDKTLIQENNENNLLKTESEFNLNSKVNTKNVDQNPTSTIVEKIDKLQNRDCIFQDLNQNTTGNMQLNSKNKISDENTKVDDNCEDTKIIADKNISLNNETPNKGIVLDGVVSDKEFDEENKNSFLSIEIDDDFIILDDLDETIIPTKEEGITLNKSKSSTNIKNDRCIILQDDSFDFKTDFSMHNDEQIQNIKLERPQWEATILTTEYNIPSFKDANKINILDDSFKKYKTGKEKSDKISEIDQIKSINHYANEQLNLPHTITSNINIDLTEPTESQINLMHESHLKRLSDDSKFNTSKKSKFDQPITSELDSFHQDITIENFTKLIFDSQKTLDENDPNWRDIKDLYTAEEFFNHVCYQWQSDTLPNPHINLTKKFVNRNVNHKLQDFITDSNSVSLRTYYDNKIKTMKVKILDFQKQLDRNQRFKFLTKKKENKMRDNIEKFKRDIDKLEINKEDLVLINQFYSVDNEGWNAQYLNKKQLQEVENQEKVMEFQKAFYN